MSWTPLTKTYCAESVQNGTLFAHTYDAPDTETAMKIAEKNGWSFLGALEAEIEVSDEEVALIEFVFTDPVVH